VINLIARSPCAGLVPVTEGAATLTEVLPEAITFVAPFAGQDKAVSDALKAVIGLGFPAPNRTTAKAGARAIWVGAGQALVLGPAVVVEGAALVDQSDAFACLALEGPAARDVLARLVPVDLRDGSFKRGHTARTLLNHMTCSLTRTGAERWEVMVFRSMAGTAVHEVSEAMRRVDARA
jgi:sarcosine oxidase subunit gamma